MQVLGPRRGFAVAVTLFALGVTGGATAGEDEGRGIDPNQGESLVEVTLPSKGAAMRLQLEADTYGVEFNDHYLRNNGDGTVTATVFGNEDELDALDKAGYDARRHDRGPRDLARADRRPPGGGAGREPRRDRRRGRRRSEPSRTQDEVVILRVDYFENYAGRFLSVEAKDRQGGVAPDGSTYVGPTLALSWDTGPGTPISTTPRVMSTNIDPDTTPDTYIEHRELVRIGDVGTTSPPRPARVRVGSSTGAFKEAAVETWLGGGLPPMSSTFQRDFTTRYMDPTEVYGRFERARGRVPEHQRAHHPAEQDERLPAQGAGHDGRHDG